MPTRSPATLYPLQLAAPDILEWLLGKEPRAIGMFDEIGSDEYARAFTAAQTAGTDIADDLYYAMVDVVERSGSEQDFAKLVMPILKEKGWLGGDEGKIGNRVRLIYDTNLRLARAAGRWNHVQASEGMFPYLRAFTVGDSRVRHPPKSEDDHRAWDGIVLPVSHPFWRTYWPPLGFRCFLPGTRIEGAVKAGIRRWHSGKAVEVVMASGSRLSVTPDHPILTRRGWVMAEHVRVGDHALRHRGVVTGNLDVFSGDDNAPPRADDLFQALSLHALGVAEPVAFKFNDQSAVGQGEIDIVFADPKLAQECVAKVGSENVLVGTALGADNALGRLGAVQNGVRETYAGHAGQARHLGLADPDFSGDAGHRPVSGGGGDAEPRFNIGVTVTADLPRPPALPLHATRRLFDGLPLDLFRLATTTQDDALFAELAANHCAADAGLFGELLDAHSSAVLLDEVVEVRQFDFAGHVYDFQTEEGVVSADGVIVHNCRCSVGQMSRSQLARYRDGITSEDELAWRIERLGPPVFAPPAAPIGQQLAEMVEETNRPTASDGTPQPRLPGLPPINPIQTERAGRDIWDAVISGRTLDEISRNVRQVVRR